MDYASKVLEVSPRDNDHCKRLRDPVEDRLFHLEAWLPFSEAAKLDRGNANVRPPSERRRPFKDMLSTVENDPASFHLKNRGITYLCEKFEYDNAKRLLRVVIPDFEPDELAELGIDEPRYGIADGGHTFEVICQTMARANELQETDGWSEPFVRVHFLAGDGIESSEVEEVVEALNTSSQVQQYTLDEYQNKFEELKVALRDGGFDTDLISFRENEEKEWDIREIVQRLACFLKDRWKHIQPLNMYKSRGKALDLFTTETTRDEFRRLYGVIVDVVTLPEFIESEFSLGDSVKSKRFGGLKAVKTLRKPMARPGTDFRTSHKMDLAASLPVAAAFRELLELHGDRYRWRLDPKEVFRRCAEDMYRLLVARSRTAKTVNSLPADTEYWTQAVNIVLRTKDDMLAERFAGRNP